MSDNGYKTDGVTGYVALLKGIFFSLVITLAGVLVFAFIVKIADLGDTVIKIVNQIIKVVAVFSGCFLCVRGKGGLPKGAIIGALSTFLTYCIFALISGGSVFGLALLIDLIFGVVVGAVSGIITVNVRKS